MERKMGREEERGKEGERRGKVRVEGGRGEKEEITNFSSISCVIKHKVTLQLQMAIHFCSHQHLTYNQNETES